MVILQFHLEPTNAADAHWWVESPDLPTLFASAPRLAECQRRALKMVKELDIKAADVRSVYAGPGRLVPRTARIVSMTTGSRNACSHSPIYRA